MTVCAARGRRGLDDRGVVGAVGQLERDVAAVGLAAAQVAGTGVEELPARRGELGDLRGGPQALAHAVRAGPRLVGQDQPVGVVGQVRVDGGDQRPVDVRGQVGVDVAAGDGADQRGRARVQVLRAVLAGPQRLAGALGGRVGRAVVGAAAVAAGARVVHADDRDGAGERGVVRDVGGDAPVAVRADDLHAGVAVGVQRGTQLLVPGDVVAALVPAAQVVDGQAVRCGAVQPADQVADGVRGKNVPSQPGAPQASPYSLMFGFSALACSISHHS